jgi:hypothetical protein
VRELFARNFVLKFQILGWATDLKTVSKATVMKRMERTGDGSKRSSEMNGVALVTGTKQNDIWGFDDADMTSELRSCVEIRNKKYDE